MIMIMIMIMTRIMVMVMVMVMIMIMIMIMIIIIMHVCMYVKQTLLYVRVLRSIHLVSPLVEVGQYHVYLTAHAQNAVPRIFALTSNARTHSLIYDYYLSYIIIGFFKDEL